MNFLKTYIFILIPLLLISCESNRLDVDVSNIKLNIALKRFEQDLFEINTDSISNELPELREKYGTFYHHYLKNVLNIGNPDVPEIAFNISGFLTDKSIREVYAESQKVYQDGDFFRDNLSKAFSYYKYHFPDKIIPQLVTYISGFNYAIVVTDSTLGLGLDMYLGKDCRFYPMLGIPVYKSNVMTKEHLIADAMKGWVTSEFPAQKTEVADLLGKMIYEGKMLYLMDAMFPKKHDSLKIGFSLEQLIWCEQYEHNIWSHFVEKQLLYSQNHSDIIQFTGEGPFTTGFDKKSPARTGTWIGWRIVRSYMKNHPEVTLSQLMEMKNAQKLLSDSKYKPKG